MRCLQFAPLWRTTRGELCSNESRHTTHDSRELLSSREWPSMDVHFSRIDPDSGEKEKEEVTCLLI